MIKIYLQKVLEERRLVIESDDGERVVIPFEDDEVPVFFQLSKIFKKDDYARVYAD